MDHANHFFPVLFDYGTHTAYVFGTLDMSTKEIDVQCGSDSGWDHWLGPGLWTIISQQLDWMADIGDPSYSYRDNKELAPGMSAYSMAGKKY